MLFTFENGVLLHALGCVSGVASFITADEHIHSIKPRLPLSRAGYAS